MLKPGSGRKPEHPVWNYFQYDSNRNVSVCMVDNCMADIKGKNATNVMNHLRRKHSEVAETLPTAAERLNKSIESRSASGSQSTSPTTPTEIGPIKREWDHKSRVDRFDCIQISKYLAKHMLPSTHVEDGSFMEMFAAFGVQGCDLPGREMIYSTLCSLAEATTENMKEDLNNARRLVITMDCWSQKDCASTHVAISASMYSLLCNAPIHILLDISETPLPIDKDVLTTKLEACVERWGIDTNKVVLIRMENSCNFMRAVNCFIEFPEHDDIIVKEVDVPLIEYKGIRVVHCLAGILQSVIRDILKRPLISNTLDTLRLFVNSGAIQFSKEKEKFLLDIPTSWRSTFHFIEDSLTEKKDDLWKFCGNNYGTCDWGKLQALKSILNPIKDLIDLLEKESLPLSNMIPSLLEISVILRKLAIPETTSRELDLSIKKKFSHIFDVKDPNFDPLPAVACLLDPTVSCFMHRSDVQDLLDAAIKHIRLSVSKQTRCEVVKQVRKPCKLFKMLHEDTAQNVVFRSGILGEDALLEKELENYMKIVPNYEDESGMPFWHQNAHLYPLLAPFAQDLLAIPASQKYDERAFTVYLHLNQRKWMYSEEDLLMRTFLKTNSIFYAD